MQQCFMFIDTGSGWTPVNDSAQDIAALDSFTIQWGTSGIDEQPDPAVMSFTLRDSMGAWSALRIPIDTLHKAYSPDSPDSPDSPAETMFAGTVSTGGSIEPHGGGWLLNLSATSRMAVWKRLQSQGPTDSTPKWDGAHWIGTPAERLAELNRRAAAQGAPEAQLDNLTLPASVAPYASSDYPSQLDLLHRLTAGPSLPQWHETYDGAESSLHPLCLADPAAVHMSRQGEIYIPTDTGDRPALQGKDIEADTTLTITEPLTQVVITAKRVKADDGKLGFDDVDITMGDQNLLPEQLTITQKSLTIESDMLAVNDSGGLWTGGDVSTITDTQRAGIARWLESHDLRMVPTSVTFNSTRLDPALLPWLYRASPSGPFLIVQTEASALTDGDGRPAFTGPLTTIGGTLSYRWRDDTPTLTQEATLTALRPALTTSIAWNDLPDVEWQRLAVLHICDLSMIQTVDDE